MKAIGIELACLGLSETCRLHVMIIAMFIKLKLYNANIIWKSTLLLHYSYMEFKCYATTTVHCNYIASSLQFEWNATVMLHICRLQFTMLHVCKSNYMGMHFECYMNVLAHSVWNNSRNTKHLYMYIKHIIFDENTIRNWNWSLQTVSFTRLTSPQTRQRQTIQSQMLQETLQ